jgi:class 3 adenylate cyclase
MSQRGRRHKTTCAPNGAKVGVGRFLHYDPVVPVCAHCGEDNPGRAKFCLACGSPLAVMSPRGDERKVVSVLFCDLVGFTSRAERLDVEDVGGLLRPYYTRLRIELERYGGTVEKFIGDAVMALFGAPVSHEDDPARAVRAALAIRNAITELNEGDLHVRIGVTTGEALVSLDARPLQGEGMASGDVVNTAARLQAAAPVDGVLVDEPTYRATKRQFRYSDAEPVRAKGKSTPVPTWQALAVRAGPAPDSCRSPFVGRDPELQALGAAVARLVAGEQSCISVIGEAGSGKTRLLEALRARVVADVQWLEGSAQPFGETTPYAPVIDLLARCLRVGGSDGESQRDMSLRAAVTGLVDDAAIDSVVSPLTRLFGVASREEASVDREAYRSRLLAAVATLIDGFAARRPTVMCLHDLHWADPSTLELLRRLPGQLTTPTLVIVNYRPTPDLDLPGDRLILGALDNNAVGALLAARLGGTASSSLLSFVATKAGSNAFFVEELVSHLAESGALRRSVVDDAWELASEADRASIPPTVRAVLAARIDGLDESPRRVAREASVVGRDFLYRILSEITALPAELGPSLRSLEDAGLMRRHTPSDEPVYLFQHALMREVAYEALVRRERARLHRAVAQALERLFTAQLSEMPELLAHHWRLAGDVERAVSYLTRSGDRAVDRYAIDEAHQHYATAYDLLMTEPPSSHRDRMFALVLCDWMQVHYYRADFIGMDALLARHIESIEALDDPRLHGMALAWYGWASTMRYDLVAAAPRLGMARRLGEEHDLPEVIAHAETWSVWMHVFAGRPRDALRSATAVEAVVSQLADPRYVILKSLAGLGYASAYAGDFAAARRATDELTEIGERTGSRRASSLAHAIRAVTAYLAGDETYAVNEGELAVAVANEPAYLEFGRAILLHVHAGFARVDEAVTTAERCRQFVAQNRTELFSVSYAPAEALVCLLQGDLSTGMTLLERSTGLGGLFGMLSDVYRAVTYARMATRETAAPLGALARNPGFVVRHGLTARRRAQRLLAGLADPLERHGLLGLRLIVDREHAKLASHFGQHDEAARLARRALPIIDGYPRPTAAADQLRSLAQGHPPASGRGETRASLDET